MKHLISFLSIWGIIGILCSSCNELVLESSDSNILADCVLRTQYNEDILFFSTAVSKALQNSLDFRELVRDEALQQLDGDYDVLFVFIKDKCIPVQTKSGVERYSVGNYIASFLPPSYLGTKSSASDYLQYLLEQYPDLQISVPVHADEWMASYIPKVAFIPENFIDGVTMTVPAIDENGNIIQIDAVNDPDEPIIVIGENERSLLTGINPNIGPRLTFLYAPYSLDATCSAQGIILSWQCDENDAELYYIYRKAEDEIAFSKLGFSNGKYNKTYTDYAITAGKYYSYYVTSANHSVQQNNDPTIIASIIENESEPSNIITRSVSEVAALSYFKSFCAGSGIEIRWNNDNIPNSFIHINYQDPRNDLTYYPLTISDAADNYYQYESMIKGRRVVYQAYRSNSIGNSNLVYDYIYPPYRNVDENSPVYITSMYVDDIKGVESWLRGKPEFQLKLLGVNSSGSTVELQSNISLEYSSRHNTEVFNNKKIYDWLYTEYGGWYSALTFNLREVDSFSSVTSQANAKMASKTPDDLTIENGQSIQVEWEHHGEDCGTSYTMYYDDPNKNIIFPNYGASIHISTTASQEE